MGIMVYSVLWAMQDWYHQRNLQIQPCDPLTECQLPNNLHKINYAEHKREAETPKPFNVFAASRP